MSDALYNPQHLTVLIVDDHDPIRKAIKRIVAAMGFGETLECFDGGDAIKILDRRPIDLVISDLYMRNVNGFELLEHVRNRDIGCDIPVVVVTGEASKEEIVKVADMGADDYVLKPFQSADLERKVTKTLNQYYSPSPLLKALRKAERFFLAGDFKVALSMFDAALKIDTESARASHGRALSLERLGRADEAIALLHENIQRNHSYHKNYGTLADILLKQNRVKDATEAMRRELEINPKQPNRQIQLAKMLIKEGDALGAVDHYRIALQEDPKRLGALMGMGHAYAMVNNLEKALYYFKRVRRYHPTATKALESAVRSALGAGEAKKAELFLRDEKSAHPERYDTYILLATLYRTWDRDDDALAVLDELLGRDEDNAKAMQLKASIFLRRGEYPKALSLLEAVAKVAPSAEILTSLGETLLRLNKIPEALETLNRAVTLNGENPYAFVLLADAHKASQQWVKAYTLYRKAAALGAPKERCSGEQRDCADEVQKRRHRPRAAS